MSYRINLIASSQEVDLKKNKQGIPIAQPKWASNN